MGNLAARAVALAVAAVASGCLGSGRFEATASAPVLLPGYNYDGSGARAATGSLEVELEARANSGTIRARFTDEVRDYELRWKNFTGREAYQSGGVARDLWMWGSTGNGSAVFPRVRAYAAAFGTVESFLDGRPEPDPSNLFSTMPALFFLAQGQYRDPLSHRVYASDERSFYDPARPDDAHVSQIGAQAALLVYTSRGELFRYVEFNEVEVLAR